MCNFNIICQVRDGTCGCGKPKSSPEIIKPIPVPFSIGADANLLGTLFRIIAQQNEMIKAIAEQTKFALEKITTIAESTSQTLTTTSTPGEEVTTSSQLQKIICGEEIQHKYSLQIVSDIPNPAYKERAFSLLLQIVDADGNKAVLPESMNFKVMLFTTESPPKLMKINTSGDKIMKGTIEAQGNSTLFFRKIAIKEVTSHFRNGCFFFVVSSKEGSSIKPLIIENFVVKARKINNEGVPKKKHKIDEKEDMEVNNL
ncbi:hypothetical protein SteCoe_13286 [Stentor coeruleus]|uniref:Uncharacterized protein n=1 Tax=Stentor coeruleus TaxID=5963 RepID=A0A1R2C8N5_9CILI|nr:hypothetical protein SteCoe_14998 [Stentor coeruleus]OMJ85378.1 hypothetical protein SteCoe_13286 [Stentor coeruleus]